jgi:imidazolonepropionase-like amidohydrolase
VHAATGLPAAVLRIAEEAGTVEAGKSGDRLVVERDPGAGALAPAATCVAPRDGVVPAALPALLAPGRR